ncbi:mechanosensitive ion channel domain-containing protein [Sulfurimonas paralvinellae]|uniref:mechanosensitive ion channel domain-containing protein n=1 Tax=Sulfurimonas paralvinellae TaxID=317658 RepID=UPI001D03A5B4|nr:mechanosensitive ion channel domain-containing protein [Sulfurimonas paralvinellae]
MMQIIKGIFFIFILAVQLWASADTIATDNNVTDAKQQAEKQRIIQSQISDYMTELNRLESQISDENVWIKSYASYLTSLDVKSNLDKIKKRIKWLSKHAKTSSDIDELNGLISKENILTSQVDQLKGKSSAPFSNLITPPKLDKIPNISNPFEIFTGLSLIKTIDANYEDYKRKKENLNELIILLRKEIGIYKNLYKIDQKKYKDILEKKQTELERFERALDTMNVTLNVYQKRLEIAKININKGIEKQVYRLVKIGIAILVVFFIFFLLKLVVKKYITDNERFYMANKIITFTNFTIIILILFFNYIENVSYLVTILGFASAGIAIAMKDWFMSILGWLVIVFGGSIHVGDRIRVDMDGKKYVGDVLDISLLRMTILEDITLTSIMQNRRAGRIVFIPNNYVFTQMIANYTHYSLKTVWDGVKITITFDSNHKKAMHLVKEITKKYSKGYTDITRKQLNKLRQHYSLKNTNVEPRIYSFIESNGLDIEAWYLTNAYGTLTLRSVISSEIVDAFNAEDDITIAYPTQKLHVAMQSEEPSEHNHELV